MQLLDLPNELLHEISKHLAQPDLLGFLKTSKFLAQLLRSTLHNKHANQERDELPAILWAAKHGYAPLVSILLEQGVNINTQFQPASPTDLDLSAQLRSNTYYNATALHLAAGLQCVETVRLLLSRGADVGIKEYWLGETAFHKAVGTSLEAESIMRLLLQYGADVDSQRLAGLTALHCAVRASDRLLVRLLLSLGADTEIRDGAGVTALSAAVKVDNLVMVKVLLEAGADVNAVDPMGNTPLMRSVELVRYTGDKISPMVILLLKKGAALSIRNGAGFTALDLAGWAGEPTVKLLREYGRRERDKPQAIQDGKKME